MSTIRFVHTDHFRLGTPLAGLADAPAWLRQLATNSVRQAVRNVIETTITQHARFLLIAGSISDSGDDLESVVGWLDEQFEPLRTRGIRVVTVAGDSKTTTMAALERISDIVLRRGQMLLASPEADGTVRLSATPLHRTTAANLVVAVGDAPVNPSATLIYQAVPSLRPGIDRAQLSTDGRLTASAGAVQAVDHSEQWECGCIVADARLSSGEIQTEMVTTDVIRFATERVSLSGTIALEVLIPEVIRASRQLDGQSTRTSVVDYMLATCVAADLPQVEKLSGESLLAELRNGLHSGHKGVWPRSVTFSPDSRIQLSANEDGAMEEYLDAVQGPVSTRNVHGISDRKVFLQNRSGLTAELVAGLSLLARVV